MKGLQPITNHHPGCLPTRYTFRTFVSQADPRVQPMKSLLQNHGHLGHRVYPWVPARVGRPRLLRKLDRVGTSRHSKNE
jgi:hypothetical protein